jgi:hypothetical protein
MTAHLHAEPYERSLDRRGFRNGNEPRQLHTRVGTLSLQVPQDRDGTFSTQLFARYQRNEKALVLALMEMYVEGGDALHVRDITEVLYGTSTSATLSHQGIDGVSKDETSGPPHRATNIVRTLKCRCSTEPFRLLGEASWTPPVSCIPCAGEPRATRVRRCVCVTTHARPKHLHSSPYPGRQPSQSEQPNTQLTG